MFSPAGLVLSFTPFETCQKLEPLYVELLCNLHDYVSNQEGRQDCKTIYMHSQQTTVLPGMV